MAYSQSGVSEKGSVHAALNKMFNAERENVEEIHRSLYGGEVPAYEFAEFPKMLHTEDGSFAVAETPEQETELKGQGYFDAATKAKKAQAEAVKSKKK